MTMKNFTTAEKWLLGSVCTLLLSASTFLITLAVEITRHGFH